MFKFNKMQRISRTHRQIGLKMQHIPMAIDHIHLVIVVSNYVNFVALTMTEMRCFYRVLQNELYNFESLHKCIQRTCTVF
jgi:hypothetical protein